MIFAAGIKLHRVRPMLGEAAFLSAQSRRSSSYGFKYTVRIKATVIGFPDSIGAEVVKVHHRRQPPGLRLRTHVGDRLIMKGTG